MAMTCEHVRDVASGFVLGALDLDEMIAVSDHLESCPGSHPEIEELGGVLPYLAGSLQPIEPPAWLRESVMAAAQADLVARRAVAEQATEPAPAPVALTGRQGTPSGTEPISLAAARFSRRRRVVAWTMRVAAVVAVIALAGYALVLQGDLARAQKATQVDASFNYVLTQPDTRTAVMSATDGSGASGLAALRPTGHIIVRLYGLTPTTGDQVYVVWLSSDAGNPIRAGSFTVDDSGTGYLEVDNVPTSSSLRLFVSREPNGNVIQPTLPAVVSGTFSL
ncbi:MAG: anti-sigma factor [Candidatus Limnocylindrales bacterium]|jgi:hypothetical protein